MKLAGFEVGLDRPFFLIAGPCVVESEPMALDTAIKDGRVNRGDLLLLEAFGGGFTWGASLVRY